MDTGVAARKRRAVRVVHVAAFAAVAIAAPIAIDGCLPELAPLNAVPEAAPLPEAAAPGPLCGDGYIDTRDNGGSADESCDPADATAVGCDRCHTVCSDSGRDDAGGHCYFTAGAV